MVYIFFCYCKLWKVFHIFTSYVDVFFCIYIAITPKNNAKNPIDSNTAIKDFNSGVGLEKEKREKLKEININLSQLNNEYAQNLLNATNAYEMI
ncbi:MAG: hypothetical protein DSY47_07800, partial [Hydrogenothermus sp.]